MQEQVSEAFRSSAWEIGFEDRAGTGRPSVFAIQSLEHPVLNYSVEVIADADDIAQSQETTAVARLFRIDRICTTRVAEFMKEVASASELKVFGDEFVHSARRLYQSVDVTEDSTKVF